MWGSEQMGKGECQREDQQLQKLKKAAPHIANINKQGTCSGPEFEFQNKKSRVIT